LGRFAVIAITCFFLALSPARAAEPKEDASPFIFSPSALAPAPSRGWVVLLPGEDELAFTAVQSHYDKVALLLNANGFDTLIVPYEEAYDEDVDGDPDSEGEKIAAVTTRAVRWMLQAHPDFEGKPGAVVAWGRGAEGVWTLAQTGSRYPLPDLVTAVAYHPGSGPDLGFDNRIQVLMQVGQQDEGLHTLRHTARTEGSVEPELAIYPDARRGFDVESFRKPRTVRSTPLIGPTVTFAYNASAAREAQQKMLTFLKSRLEAPE
jgi:dienelactone hydrolase